MIEQEQPYLWHVIRGKTKLGNVVWRVRRVRWESYVLRMKHVKGADDGRYFVYEDEAQNFALAKRIQQKKEYSAPIVRRLRGEVIE